MVATSLVRSSIINLNYLKTLDLASSSGPKFLFLEQSGQANPPWTLIECEREVIVKKSENYLYHNPIFLPHFFLAMLINVGTR